MVINDEYILNKYWNGKIQTFVRYMKSNKCLPEEIEYVQNRYNDSNSIEETLYRIKHHIEKCPICKICGNSLIWTKKHGYHTYCSKHCSNLDPISIDKRQKGLISKYGQKSPFASLDVREKRDKTWKKKYGGNPFTNDNIRKKIQETCLNKYGVSCIGLSKESKEKAKQTCLEKYGVDNYAKTKEFVEKAKQTCIEKYGDWYCNTDEAADLSHSQKANEKRYNTMKENNSWSTSKPEEEFYNNLCFYFGQKNIERNYCDNIRYPFHCDFYVKPIDLFIECNFHWTHGGHPYDKNSIQDQVILERWKSKHTKYYDKAIETWTIRDVNKHKYVKSNNLNYIEFYDESEVYYFYIELDKTMNII